MQFKNLNENYIRVYDDVIPQLMCDHMIEEFEKNEDQFDKQTLKGHRSFTQIFCDTQSRTDANVSTNVDTSSCWKKSNR
jgi:hypothetical protein